MGKGVVTYEDMITDAIRGCPRSAIPWEVLQQTVAQVALQSAAHPRVRKLAYVGHSSRSAREAQLSQLADLEDRVADGYRARWRTPASDSLTPRLLAELTISILDVTFREWLKHDSPDIRPTIDHVFATLRQLLDATGKPRRIAPKHRRTASR